MRDLQLYAKHGESKKYNNQISKIIQYTIQGYIYKLFYAKNDKYSSQDSG